MSSRWFLVPLLIPLLSSIAFSQKLINGFTRELAIHGLPTGFSLKSFDVTGDSTADFFVLTGNQLLAFDGKNFSMIFKDSTAPGTANLSSADVNRDGIPDLIANSKDTAIVVWYGPDFTSRSIFPAPRGGFGAFAVRNRQDGQVEFSFGYGDFHDTTYYVCYDSYLDGFILKYVDTTFVLSDSVHLEISPNLLRVIGATESDGPEYLLMGRDVSTSTCPSSQSDMTRIQHLDSQIVTLSSFGPVLLPFGQPCPSPVMGAWTLGNIDADSAREFIRLIYFSGYPGCGLPWWNFSAIDVRTGAVQWQRTEALNISGLFTIDLNGDGVQELLSYEIQSALPGLAEYRSSDGATLGFTQLPFTPSVLQVGLFGSPPAPRVLLGQGDSLVVYRICTAASKGDLNTDGSVTILDIPLELNCVFLGMGTCDLCLTDVNCNGVLSPTDVVLELLAVFLDNTFPC